MEQVEAGYALDALVAERVFGFRRERPTWLGGKEVWTRGLSTDETNHDTAMYASIHDSAHTPLWSTSTHEDVLPKFSTDMAAAWWVVERLQQLAHVVTLRADSRDGHFHYSVAVDSLEPVESEQAPLAICLAAVGTLP